MRFMIHVTSKEYDELIEKSGAKSLVALKNFIKKEYNINNDFLIRVYSDDYEFDIIEKEGEKDASTS